MNLLHKETSPYLLQHKDNPVHWMPYGDDAFKKARLEQKLILISIGYSACHWCHVMEKEVFENEECAALMNKYFVCVKVDREERPDVDHYYMDAVHLMGGRGGWPLNAFALPDGRPVYGGTYFPKQQWIDILEKLSELFSQEPERMMEYATSLAEGLRQLSVIHVQDEPQEFDSEVIHNLVERWSAHWDTEKGGAKRAPKFPMPNNWEFLLHYAQVFFLVSGKENLADKARNMVFMTLDKMAMGGIYDHIGGGFCRYSVDAEWKVPHFEKMLYDNAQLLSLYSKGYQVKKDPFYLKVIEETITFIDHELTSPEGLFYSALDADSEGEEGKYYVWTDDEIKSTLGSDSDFAMQYFSIGKESFWEHDKNNLLTPLNDDDFAKTYSYELEFVQQKVSSIRELLYKERNKRIRPGLDYKSITSWNALMVKALTDVYDATGKEIYLKKAIGAAEKIWELMYSKEGILYRIRTSERTTIPGFLDDYSFLIEAFILLFQSSGDRIWYERSSQLLKVVIDKFYDHNSGLFRFGTTNEPHSQKLDTQDNVIPSSNSCLSKSLFIMSHINQDEYIGAIATKMLLRIIPSIDYASGYSNWLQHYLWQSESFYELAITGKEADIWSKSLREKYLPQKIVAASTIESELPILKDKFGTVSAIYVCAGKTCFPPVEKVQDALTYLK